jgi:hypothetical protein
MRTLGGGEVAKSLSAPDVRLVVSGGDRHGGQRGGSGGGKNG